ncbi:MAG: serine hydrolase [Candidatus Paceibacterota bacterium]
MIPDNFKTNQNAQADDAKNTSGIRSTSTRMPVVQQLTVLGMILLAIFSSSFIPDILSNITSHTAAQVSEIPADPAANSNDLIKSDGFENITVTAKSAFVYDVHSKKVLYEKNPDEQLPIASITKLMTALVAHEIIEKTAVVSIPELAILQESASGLMYGETFSFDVLADLMLLSSSNDGAVAIAAAAGAALDNAAPAQTFVEAMNVRADELGLTETYFRNPTGLDISETEAGAFGSARDIASLMEYILKNIPELLEATTQSANVYYNQTGEFHEVENTNHIVNKITGLIGSKTGYTTLAGGNLTVAFDASLNRPIVVVVLGSTYNGRFNDVLTLSEAARSEIKQ